MSALPIGKDHNARTSASDYACDLQAVDPGVLDAAIGNIKRLPPSRLEKPSCLAGLAFPIGGGAACAHFAASEVENAGAPTGLGCLQQGPATGLFNVVAMRGDSEDLEVGLFGFGNRH